MRPVLLYDDGCRLCRFAARCAVRLDRRNELGLLPLSDPTADALLARLPKEEHRSSWRLTLADGRLVGEGAGAIELLRATGHDRWAALLDALPDRILEGAYRLVARHRSRLGRLVPDGPAPHRS